jgi:hypothetical protein
MDTHEECGVIEVCSDNNMPERYNECHVQNKVFWPMKDEEEKKKLLYVNKWTKFRIENVSALVETFITGMGRHFI